ncbi:Hsp20/alpha crystallin family protein [Ancylostoma caninum]|uniref:Hsp20/alpha crystallin family protein n=1 Tax=Ancylostoma caninum TaxID=29170 RepID=A0A368G6P7_ANCCA|nr:Hsp20/alpha crystallin family protein [Ancylostoma caninum]
MSLWPRSPAWEEQFRDFPFFDRFFDRSMMPYWRNADHSVLHVANETQQVVNNDQKFAVSLDVSQFRPDELKVHIQGHDLIVEGKQQNKSDNSYMERSFVRKWTLPENVNIDGVRSELNDVGHLTVEAPKVGHQLENRRQIPILRSPTGPPPPAPQS